MMGASSSGRCCLAKWLTELYLSAPISFSCTCQKTSRSNSVEILDLRQPNLPKKEQKSEASNQTLSKKLKPKQSNPFSNQPFSNHHPTHHLQALPWRLGWCPPWDWARPASWGPTSPRRRPTPRCRRTRRRPGGPRAAAGRRGWRCSSTFEWNPKRTGHLTWDELEKKMEKSMWILTFGK